MFLEQTTRVGGVNENQNKFDQRYFCSDFNRSDISACRVLELRNICFFSPLKLMINENNLIFFLFSMSVCVCVRI